MNNQQIIMIEALLETFTANSTPQEKEAAETLCSILGDETGDVLNDLLDRIYPNGKDEPQTTILKAEQDVAVFFKDLPMFLKKQAG